MKTRNAILLLAITLLTAAPARSGSFGLNILTSEDIKAGSSDLAIPAPEADLSVIDEPEAASYLADSEPGADMPEKNGAPAAARLGGDGMIKLYHEWSKESLEVRYRDEHGRYIPEAMARIKHFMRCRLTGREMDVPSKLVELLDIIQEKAGGRTITVLCGYRSPELNGALAGASGALAKNSLHMKGWAADIRIDGVRTSALRDIARAVLAGGVGYYPADGFVHVDVGPVRSW